jgi:hypothetical protein
MPVEQAMPFSTYAQVGAQQQARVDKYRDSLAEMVPDLAGIEEDTEAVRKFTDDFRAMQEDAISKINSGQDVPSAVAAIGKLKRMSALDQGSEGWAVKQRATERATDFKNIDAVAGKTSPEIANYKKRVSKVFTPELGYTPDGGYNQIQPTEVVKPLSDQEETLNVIKTLSAQGTLRDADAAAIQNVSNMVAGGVDGATVFQTLTNVKGVDRQRIIEGLSAGMLDRNSDVFKSRKQDAEYGIYQNLMDTEVAEGRMTEKEAIVLAKQQSDLEAEEGIKDYINGIATLAQSEAGTDAFKVIQDSEGKTGGKSKGPVPGTFNIQTPGYTQFKNIAKSSDAAEQQIKDLDTKIEEAENEGNNLMAYDLKEKKKVIEGAYQAASTTFLKENSGIRSFIEGTTFPTEWSNDKNWMNFSVDKTEPGSAEFYAAMAIEEYQNSPKTLNSVTKLEREFKEIQADLYGNDSKYDVYIPNTQTREIAKDRINSYLKEVIIPKADTEKKYKEEFDQYIADGGGINTNIYGVDRANLSRTTGGSSYLTGLDEEVRMQVQDLSHAYEIEAVTDPGKGTGTDVAKKNITKNSLFGISQEDRKDFLAKLGEFQYIGLEGGTEWSDPAIIYSAKDPESGVRMTFRATPKASNTQANDFFNNRAADMGMSTGMALIFDRTYKDVKPGTENYPTDLSNIGAEGVKYTTKSGLGHRVSNIKASDYIATLDNPKEIMEATKDYLAAELNLTPGEARLALKLYSGEQEKDTGKAEWTLDLGEKGKGKKLTEEQIDKALENPYMKNK